MSAAPGSAKKPARNGGGLLLAGASGLAAWATLSSGSGSPLFAAPSAAPSASTGTETSLRGALAAAEFGAVPAVSQTPEASTSLLGGAAVAALVTGSVAAAARRRSATTTTRREVGVARAAGDAPLVVIAGPPAAGKGTQCEKIKAKYGYVHISTGDILRENVKNGTELGKKAKEFMDSGALVPSELIVDLVKDRLTKDDVKEKGCLLDGFPRAPDQAQAMADAGIDVQRFLLIKVPDDTLVERGCGRRLDPETGDIYHLKFKPPPAEIMDRLVHRSDDQEEQIRVRLGAYHSQIDGILPFFKDVVVEIDGTGKPDDVFTAVTAGLDSM